MRASRCCSHPPAAPKGHPALLLPLPCPLADSVLLGVLPVRTCSFYPKRAVVGKPRVEERPRASGGFAGFRLSRIRRPRPFQTELARSLALFLSLPHTHTHTTMSSSSQPNGSAQEPGRAFFNTFFNDALHTANLQEPSLRAGAASSGAASTSQLAGNGLDCGRDPGPSAEELEAMANAVPTQLTTSSSSGDSEAKSTRDDDEDEEARDQLSSDSIANRRGRGADLAASSSSIASLTASMREASVSSTVARSSAAQSAHHAPHPILSRQSSFSLRSGARTPVMDKDGLGFPGESRSAEGETLEHRSLTFLPWQPRARWID